MTKALAQDPAGVSELLAGTAPGQGLAGQLGTLIESFTGSQGLLAAATNGVNGTLKSLDARYAATELGVQAKVSRFRAQFTELDRVMARMNSTTSYLSQQFAAMNGQK